MQTSVNNERTHVCKHFYKHVGKQACKHACTNLSKHAFKHACKQGFVTAKTLLSE